VRSTSAVLRAAAATRRQTDVRPVADRGAGPGRACAPRSTGLCGFHLTAELDGQIVEAAWSHGVLHCDRALLDRAALLVDLEEVFLPDPSLPGHTASLTGPPVAVLLTLIRSCDQVRSVELA
jgi:hypothetical protein